MNPARLITITVVALLTGCAGKPKAEPAKSPPPASVKNGGVKEGDLATVTLTPEAAERLGIATATVEYKPAPRVRVLAGDVVLPPGQSVTVTAPTAGRVGFQGGPPRVGTAVSAGQILCRLAPFATPQRDLKSGAEAELRAAAARVETAGQRFARAERMLRDQVGSVRAVEEARQELEQARAVETAARAKLDQINRAPLDADTPMSITAPLSGILRQVLVGDGQSVAGGAVLFEVARLSPVWIRVPVYTGEAGTVESGAAVRVGALGASPRYAMLARPVKAPPTGDPLAATVDLYYELPNGDAALRPGEKLQVELPLRGRETSLQVPYAAILYDIHGNAWVYENTAPRAFTRRRVELDHVAGATAILSRGPKPGARVVTSGAAELFGTEFGAGK